MRSLKSVRPLDAAIVAVAIAVLLIGGWLGWSVWSQNRSVAQSTPVGRAISDLKQQIRKKPSDILLRMQLAQAYTIAGQDNEAVDQYQQILKIRKNYVDAISGLGFIASRQKDWAEAEEYWRKATKLMSAAPNARMSKQYETANFYLGTTLLEQKKYEDAVGSFKEALRVNRSASDTHYLLAHAYKGLDAPDEYRSELELTLAFDPSLPEANYDYGVLLLAEGDEPGAAQHFRIAADRAPNRKEPQEALEKLGPYSKRIALAQKLKGEDPKKALVEARVAVALEPKNVDGLLLLAALFEETGEKTSAADTYRNVLTIDTDNSEATASLKRVTDGK
ncbi:MAG TPA: tetratricopeptide repeat protein [Coriobacteriia bacterium]|nr:tetratricopeptide repeat protein [Coriobacteriia bacterium]